MNHSHFHLLLNHVPTIGAVAVLGLLLLSFVRKSEHLAQAGLEALYLVALLTLPAYITGVGASRELRDVPGVSDFAMRMHHDAALWGFTVLELAGFFGWIALWQTRRRNSPGRGVVLATTGLLVVALAMMAGAANLGGEIRHPEISSGPAVAEIEGSDAADVFVAAAISNFVVASTWGSPAGETLHFLGMSLSIGVLLAVNLRILGVMRHVRFAHLHRLLPWGMLGFGVNLVTGMMFLIGTPGQYVTSVPFYWKVGLLMVAGGNYLYLTVAKSVWTGDERGFTPVDRAMAVGSVVAWLGILFAGRMLPFLGNSF